MQSLRPVRDLIVYLVFAVDLPGLGVLRVDFRRGEVGKQFSDFGPVFRFDVDGSGFVVKFPLFVQHRRLGQLKSRDEKNLDKRKRETSKTKLALLSRVVADFGCCHGGGWLLSWLKSVIVVVEVGCCRG